MDNSHMVMDKSHVARLVRFRYDRSAGDAPLHYLMSGIKNDLNLVVPVPRIPRLVICTINHR